jgi:hypothetical protein
MDDGQPETNRTAVVIGTTCISFWFLPIVLEFEMKRISPSRIEPLLRRQQSTNIKWLFVLGCQTIFTWRCEATLPKVLLKSRSLS